MAPVSNKEFLDIQATIECSFTLKLVREMIIRYIQTLLLVSDIDVGKNLFFNVKLKLLMNQGRRESGGRWSGGGGGGEAPVSQPFFWSKNFFSLVKSKNNFYMWITCETLVCLLNKTKWQKVGSFSWICCFSSRLSYHSYLQRVCKLLFLIRTSVKTNSNLMCVSLRLI